MEVITQLGQITGPLPGAQSSQVKVTDMKEHMVSFSDKILLSYTEHPKNIACHPSSHYWAYFSGAVFLNQVTTNYKIAPVQ